MSVPQERGNDGSSTGALLKPGRHKDTIGFPLTQEDIDEFKALMRDECGVDLSNQEAWNRATELLGLFRMLMGPIPEDSEVGQMPDVVQTSSDLPSLTESG